MPTVADAYSHYYKQQKANMLFGFDAERRLAVGTAFEQVRRALIKMYGDRVQDDEPLRDEALIAYDNFIEVAYNYHGGCLYPVHLPIPKNYRPS